MLQALIFDFDGLILDTESCDLQAWQELYAEFHLEFPLDAWLRSLGTRAEIFEPYQQLAAAGNVSAEALRAKRRTRMLALIDQQPVRAGVRAYLKEANQRGLKVGLASSSERAWVNGYLEHLGLKMYFHAIRCADDVTHTKPHPELYEAVMRVLGVTPAQTIALEDSPNGIKAAKAAGIFCLAVPNPVTALLPLDHADKRVDSLEAISLTELMRLVP